MLLGMWTTAATFYGLMFVDFPSLQELGSPGRSQHGGVRTGHAVSRARDAAAQGAHGAARARAARARRLDPPAPHRRARRIARRDGACSAPPQPRIRINPTLERLRSTTDAAAVEARIASTFGLPGEVSVILAHGPDLERLLTTNEALVARLAQELPTVRVEPPSRLLPSQCHANAARGTHQSFRHQSRAASAHRSPTQPSASGFQPGAFDAFVERVPRLLDPSSRLTYDDYVSSGFGDLIGRFITHEGQDAWTIATYVFPANA